MIDKIKRYIFFLNYGCEPHEHVLFTALDDETMCKVPYEACSYVESWVNRDGYIKWRQCKYKRGCQLV